MYSTPQTNPVLLKKNMHQFIRKNSLWNQASNFCEHGVLQPPTSWSLGCLTRRCWEFYKPIKLGERSFVSKPRTIHLHICFHDPLTKSRNPLAGKAQLSSILSEDLRSVLLGSPVRQTGSAPRPLCFVWENSLQDFSSVNNSDLPPLCLRHSKICQAVFSVCLRRWWRGNLVPSQMLLTNFSSGKTRENSNFAQQCSDVPCSCLLIWGRLLWYINKTEQRRWENGPMLMPYHSEGPLYPGSHRIRVFCSWWLPALGQRWHTWPVEVVSQLHTLQMEDAKPSSSVTKQYKKKVKKNGSERGCWSSPWLAQWELMCLVMGEGNEVWGPLNTQERDSSDPLFTGWTHKPTVWLWSLLNLRCSLTPLQRGEKLNFPVAVLCLLPVQKSWIARLWYSFLFSFASRKRTH